MALGGRIGVNDSFWKWLFPGLKVKRWLALLLLGLLIVSLGASFIYISLYRAVQLPETVSPLAYYATLQFVPHFLRGLVLDIIGLLIVGVAILQLNRSLLSAVHTPGQGKFVDLLYQRRVAERGPRIVAIGGGHGLASLLRGMKKYTQNLTAVVTMADDGGSSGRLRRDLGIPPPGDLRHCITALADDESLLAQLFEYRFGGSVGLNGHNLGNLFIAAMSEITGNFERGVAESSKVLAVHGQILPSTLENVTLSAELSKPKGNANLVQGESAITEAEAVIERVYLRPDSARGYPEALRAILEADIITIGPGSLYTSIMPNLLVNDVCQAIRASGALRVYVCNVATQPGETDNYDVGDHLQAIEDHTAEGIVDYVVANDNLSRPLPAEGHSRLVKPTFDSKYSQRIILADLVSQENPWRHDPERLARCIMQIYEERDR
jgi:uncharacterized cofD-like protein